MNAMRCHGWTMACAVQGRCRHGYRVGIEPGAFYRERRFHPEQCCCRRDVEDAGIRFHAPRLAGLARESGKGHACGF